MRSLLRYLPLFLTLLIPLAFLAWFGSQEMTRLEAQSASLLVAEARTFLNNEEKKVRFEIERVADESLDAAKDALSNRELSIVEASHQLSKRPFILQAFVADLNFELIHPRVSRAARPSAPLAELPEEQDSEQRDLWRAEILCDLHDDEGAIQALDTYVDQHKNSLEHTEGLTWAYFRLAGLLAKTTEDTDDILFHYYGAQVAAERTCMATPTADAAAVMLLCEMRAHQINANPERMIELLEQICSGRQDYMEYISEDVLEWIIGRIVEDLIPAGDPKLIERRDACLALDRLRTAQRRFANEYDDRARARLALDHRSGQLHSYKDVIFQTMATTQGTGMLVMRPASREERRVHGSAARWVGLLLDLPALIGSTPRSTAGNVALSVLDPAGQPLLAGPPAPADTESPPAPDFTPVVSRLARLQFVAIPTKNIDELLSAARNQGLLILILVLVALAGAFLLIRSVNRETELAKTKVNLLSRVSHELKTPLAVIKMYGETLGLGRTKDQTQVSRFAGIISHEADRLTGMVERILDFSKMEAGTYKYEKEHVDLGDVVDAVTEEYLPHIESQGLDLTSDVTHGLSAYADPRALEGSLVSFLENALKYTPDDAADRSLEVILARRGEQAVLEVRDHGVGIPADELDKIFTDFYRASNAGEVRGAGIGLSIVDHFARSHDGKVEALPRADGGTGTIMRLTLPLNGSDSAHPQS